MDDLKTESQCRLVYNDILNGFTFLSQKSLYIRHHTETDGVKTEILRQKYTSEAEKVKLPSETEKLDLLCKFGHWTQEEEKAYKEALAELDSLKYSAKGLVIPAQIKDIAGKIKDKLEEINLKFGQRAELIGLTREKYADNQASIMHVVNSLYKDEKLSIRYLSEEELDFTSDREIGIFIDIYYEAQKIYTERNLKRIAVCPFFLNTFLLCGDDIFSFFGRPLYQLTIYQLSLLAKGRYYKSILSEGGIVSPPEEYYQDLDKVVQHYDREYSIVLGKRSNNHIRR